MNIWVNGCFDILHTGHINLLWYAKLYGTDGLEYHEALKANKLFVGLDSDERVKSLKGDKRPINNIETRTKIMSNLKMVDSVNIFSSETELEYFIKVFNIDYIAIGEEYKNKRIVGSEYSKQGIIYNPIISSTTSIIEKIKKEAQIEIFEKMMDESRGETDSVSMNFFNYALANLRKIDS